MASDAPEYRPLERFWPYADLPKNPTDEELAAIDPELHDALFGSQPRPFSITVVFPEDGRAELCAARCGSGARLSAEFQERWGRATGFDTAPGSGRATRRGCATCFRSLDRPMPPRC